MYARLKRDLAAAAVAAAGGEPYVDLDAQPAEALVRDGNGARNIFVKSAFA